MGKKIGAMIILVMVISFIGIFKRSRTYMNDRDIYEMVISIHDDVEREIWNGFNISEFPIAFRNPKDENVIFKGEEIRRKPVFNRYVCTASEVDGKVNIFVLSKSEMGKLVDMAEGMHDGKEFILREFGFAQGLNENQYIAVIFHEGMHAHQQMIMDMQEYQSHYKGDENIISIVDENETIKSYYDREREALVQALSNKNKGNIDYYIKKFKNTRTERLSFLKNELSEAEYEILIQTEDFLELFEGTARYMEYEVCKLLNDEDLEKKYNKSLQEYINGKEKYYRSGMGICELLDLQESNWKEEVFGGRKSLFQLLN